MARDDAAGHGTGEGEQLVDGDRQRGLVAVDVVGRGVADEQQVDAGLVEGGGGVHVVGGEHGDLVAALLHLPQVMGADLLDRGRRLAGLRCRTAPSRRSWCSPRDISQLPDGVHGPPVRLVRPVPHGAVATVTLTCLSRGRPGSPRGACSRRSRRRPRCAPTLAIRTLSPTARRRRSSAVPACTVTTDVVLGAGDAHVGVVPSRRCSRAARAPPRPCPALASMAPARTAEDSRGGVVPEPEPATLDEAWPACR